jgi:hypothetical protein
MLLRYFFSQFASDLLPSCSCEKIQSLDVGGVLREIDDARAEETARRVRMGV